MKYSRALSLSTLTVLFSVWACGESDRRFSDPDGGAAAEAGSGMGVTGGNAGSSSGGTAGGGANGGSTSGGNTSGGSTSGGNTSGGSAGVGAEGGDAGDDGGGGQGTEDPCAAGDDCDDGDACTIDDVCGDDGRCRGTRRDCADERPCSVDSCNPANGQCLHDTSSCACLEAGDCDDGDPCTEDTCEDGACAHEVRSGASCDDGNACTAPDQCDEEGQCVGAPVSCTDTNPCTDSACNPANGQCQHTIVIGRECSDGNACTSADLCQSTGSCVGETVVCNDSNVCTTDTCNPASGCVFTNNTATCNDGGQCTNNDRCSGGSCRGTVIAGCFIGQENFSDYGGAQSYEKIQTFVAPAFTIGRVDIYTPGPASGRWEVRILSALPVVSDDVVSTSDRDLKTLGVASVASSSTGWVTLNFTTPIAVTAGQTYYLYLPRTTVFGAATSNSNWAAGPEGGADEYPGGVAMLARGYQWIPTCGSCAGGTEMDYTFRIYP